MALHQQLSASAHARPALTPGVPSPRHGAPLPAFRRSGRGGVRAIMCSSPVHQVPTTSNVDLQDRTPFYSSKQQQHQQHTASTSPSTTAPPSAEVSFAMLSTVTLGLAGALALALPDASHAQDLQGAHSSLSALQPQFDLAGGEDLLTNIARYGRYFITVMLGTGYVMLRPLAGAFKNPLSSILATAGLIGGAVLLKFTLELMLGVTDAGDLSFDYVQGNF
ncbi:hypothetical protein DUNSADRAFT_3481 [Dunaliella salina]|uniref:Uncharacterized protein ycf33 n=1 Tax=Dunaliella salina TaxID=3046 RepID=A0ABQ7GTW8_DUNSA|nr:hypothetical protein DUNSADRAFT_3481 [Dunaliella salina]|eukprot:KAF5838047.1 hypothetical protein DUNSADRAFT_3481 [Dunaliella salina]